MQTTAETKKNRGRPISFDREAILTEAMELFWDNGYNSLSINEIAKETGLTRASLYNSFESKEALFMEAFHHYFKQSPDKLLRQMKTGEPVGPTLLEALKRAAALYLSDTKKRGCLGVNCFSELMSPEDKFSQEVTELYESFKTNLANMVQQAIDQGELPDTTNASDIANLILIFLNGYSVFSKSKTSIEEMHALAYNFLGQLGFKNLS